LKFLEVASFGHGEVINFSEIARECGESRKVVENFFEILEDLLIGFFLPVFSKKAKRKLITHEKFYFFDVGVYQQISPKGILDSAENIWGAAIESFVGLELRSLNHYLKLDFEIYFWRSVNGEEVDFILYGTKDLIAIEVKASKKINRKDFKSLLEFKNDYPMAKLFYLYCGDREEEYGDVLCLPIWSFLKRFSSTTLKNPMF
jgi:predicted AAA+ superfamily ATPase